MTDPKIAAAAAFAIETLSGVIHPYPLADKIIDLVVKKGVGARDEVAHLLTGFAIESDKASKKFREGFAEHLKGDTPPAG